jgi:hypothetical protein
MNALKPMKFKGSGPTPLAAEIPDSATVAVGPDLRAPAGPSSWLSFSPPANEADGPGTTTLWLLGEAKQEPLHLWICPTLSWEDRVMGFVGCYIIGTALSVSSMISFPALVAGHPAPFAWKYSAGNALGLLSTSFLVGPKTQLRSMMSPIRLGTTAVYLTSIVVTLFCAIILHIAALTLVAMVVQLCALLWYCASYIPFGRQLLRGCLGKLVSV